MFLVIDHGNAVQGLTADLAPASCPLMVGIPDLSADLTGAPVPAVVVGPDVPASGAGAAVPGVQAKDAEDGFHKSETPY
jgi:hypothetical protein